MVATNDVLGMSYRAFAEKWGRSMSTITSDMKRGYCHVNYRAVTLGMSYRDFARKVNRCEHVVAREMRQGYCTLLPRVTVAHPLYVTFHQMIQRCYNPGHKSYAYYGGRGILVCARWFYSFENFVTDMGERPEGMTLDRIDTNKGYEPTNCRWATAVQQAQNRRNAIPPEILDLIPKKRFDEGWTIKRISEEFDVSDKVILACTGRKTQVYREKVEEGAKKYRLIPAKLSEEKIELILNLTAEGALSGEEIARRCGVSGATVAYWVRKRGGRLQTR